MNKDNILSICLPLLKQLEGCRLKAYTDQGGRITIGYGHTGGIALGTEWSQQQAEEALLADASHTLEQVLGAVKVPLNDNQLAALLSFTFNLGIGNLKKSGLLKKVNLQQFKEASEQFLLWVYIGMYKSEGLHRRRTLERNLFLKESK